MERVSFTRRCLTAPWLWATLATVGFYQSIPSIPVGQDLVDRYFCSHPLERILAALFFVGMSIIAVKAVLLIFERRALTTVPDFGNADADGIDDQLAVLEGRIAAGQTHLVNTYWGRRLQHLATFFRGRKSIDGLADHLSYLSEAALDRMHASHALLQTVIWSIPILGFLGTVMGITLAIANVTPDQLDTSLNEVTGGLAVAFDTTALALSLSLILGFASLFAKRSEENLLATIDEKVRLEVHRCFSASVNHPLVAAEAAAAESLIAQTNNLVQSQTQVWTDAITKIREEWADVIDQQKVTLSDSLQAGTQQTLQGHAEQLAESRELLVQSQNAMTERFLSHIADLEARREAADAALAQSLQGFLQQQREAFNEQSSRQQALFDESLQQFVQGMSKWQDQTSGWQIQLEQLGASMQSQATALSSHSDTLAKMVDGEERLIRLQSSLDRNLDVVRNAEKFDETLHNLTAAIHLLTARARVRDAA